MQVQKALSFATEKHGQQKRKNSGDPYVNHCIRVSATVKQYSTDEDLAVRAICLEFCPAKFEAALLHDTLEDTDITYDELKREFGARVADIVMALTNDKNGLASLGKRSDKLGDLPLVDGQIVYLTYLFTKYGSGARWQPAAIDDAVRTPKVCGLCGKTNDDFDPEGAARTVGPNDKPFATFDQGKPTSKDDHRA